MTLFALAAMSFHPILAFDPLMDEPGSSPVWSVSKDVSYLASSTPTWEAASWLGISKEIGLERGRLDLSGSMGFLAGDFQLDSLWNLEPRASLAWSWERLTMGGWGWALWNDRGWTDEGGGSDLSWILSDPQAIGPVWKSAVHGWMSGNAGSAIGLELFRAAKSADWSNAMGVTASRLWEVDADVRRPGGVGRIEVGATKADKWQLLFRANLDRNWMSLSVGGGFEVDIRMSEADAAGSSGSMGKGRSMNSTKNLYQGSVDPYISGNWTPGTWVFSVTTGWSTGFLQSRGSLSTTIFWTSMGASKSW